MSDKNIVIGQIRAAFPKVEYPSDDFLQGSKEGCEPYEVISPFMGKNDCNTVDAEFLDTHYQALSFLSERGFRFFLPAYLLADLQEKLKTEEDTNFIQRMNSNHK